MKDTAPVCLENSSMWWLVVFGVIVILIGAGCIIIAAVQVLPCETDPNDFN